MRTIRCNKILIGDRVVFEGKKKTVVALCVGSVMLSDKTFDELLSLSKEELDIQLKKDYEKWIDLDKLVINGMIVCAGCRKENCSNNEKCHNCEAKL